MPARVLLLESRLLAQQELASSQSVRCARCCCILSYMRAGYALNQPKSSLQARLEHRQACVRAGQRAQVAQPRLVARVAAGDAHAVAAGQQSSYDSSAASQAYSFRIDLYLGGTNVAGLQARRLPSDVACPACSQEQS